MWSAQNHAPGMGSGRSGSGGRGGASDGTGGSDGSDGNHGEEAGSFAAWPWVPWSGLGGEPRFGVEDRIGVGFSWVRFDMLGWTDLRPET